MGRQNLTEGAIDKVLVSFRCPLELKYKVYLKFGKGGTDSIDTQAFIACCEAATKDVKLTKEILDVILEEQAEAFKERMRKRLLRDMKNGKA